MPKSPASPLAGPGPHPALLAAITGALALVLYAVTRAPDLTFIDSGELAAAATTLGIAHPTGYPLYVLIGHVLATAPGPGEPIARMTLFSAACGALAAAFAADGARRILRAAGLSGGPSAIGGLAAGLILATARTPWEQSVVVEVYALHLLLLTVLLDLTLVAGDLGLSPRARTTALVLLAYGAGLALTNHLSIAFLLPALAFYLLRQGTVRIPIGLLAAGFAIGISAYLYLPIRSACEPALDWGDPETFGNFYRHASGAVYRVWFLSSTAVAQKQFGRFLALVPIEMSPLGLAPAAVGIAILWRKRQVLAQALILLVILNLLYAVNYDIHDIDAYFLPAFLVLALWAGIGIGLAAAALGRWRSLAPRGRTALGLVLALLVPAFALEWNYSAASQRNQRLVVDYTTAMFASLEPNAVILSRQWDYFCSAVFYEQLVRGHRRDVTLIEKELLRRRWYLKQLARQDPELDADCADLRAEFAHTLAPFETGRTFDQQRLQALYVDLIQCYLTSAMAHGRPVYLTPDALEPGIAAGLVQVPVGLAMRLYREPPPSPPAMPDGSPSGVAPIRGLARALRSGDPPAEQCAGLAFEMATRRAIYLAESGHRPEAIALLDSIRIVAPEYGQARRVAASLAPAGARAP